MTVLLALYVSSGCFAFNGWEQATQAVLETSGADPCRALESSDFTSIEDAATQITSATFVAAHERSPAYCQVQGYVVPQVGFDLRLPSAHWNGRFLEIGCAGLCGVQLSFFCDGPLKRGYACITSDMGHRGTPSQGLWAYNNLSAQIDFAYRGTHVALLAGKAISERFYNRAPVKSYFFGCSTGGYQGMVEAQRFPFDFDGIVAIAPDMDEAAVMMRWFWAQKNLLGEDGKPLLGAADLKIVHAAAVAKCGADGGIRDGIIGDPRACKFDPAALVCKPGLHSSCLSKAQAQAVRNIYGGPAQLRGVPPGFDHTFLPGSELRWAETLPDQSDVEFFRYALGVPALGQNWQPGSISFTHDYQRLGMGAIYNNTNPDLRAFKSAGGKLLIAQGWADDEEPPLPVVDYYETVEKTMGGRAATMDFARLFMIPGMQHCTGGDGAFAIDYFSYLEDWVEKGSAPDVMIGSHVANIDWLQSFMLQFPLDASTPISFTRPHYPYPIRAMYRGQGDPNAASSFKAVAPEPASHVR